MSTPTLSVMIPNYNHARFIPEAMEAILAQSIRPLEVVIIDDGSTDESFSILEAYARQYPSLIRVIRNERNLGLLPNLERLLALARGDCMFVPAFDDRILPTFLEKQLQLLATFPTAGLCSSLSLIMDERGCGTGIVKTPLVRKTSGFLAPSDVRSALRSHGSWFMGNTTVFRTESLRAAGGYIRELGPYCDGFISMVIASRHGACFIPEPLAVWRRMDGTYSRRFTADVDATARILAAAERLMRTTYRDFFPASVIDAWKREMYFGAASSFVTACEDQQFHGLERLMISTDAVDRTFLTVLRAIPMVGRILAKPYLFLRLRRGSPWQLIGRRLFYLSHSWRLT